MKIKIILFFYFFILMSCHRNKELVIEPILVHKYFKYSNSAKANYDEYPYAPLEYFQLDHYKNLSNDELLNKLETYVNTHYDIEKIKRGNNHEFLFYKKSFFINYRNHLTEDEIDYEFGRLLNYKNIALIYYYKSEEKDNKMFYTRIIYDQDSIVLKREDTLMIK